MEPQCIRAWPRCVRSATAEGIAISVVLLGCAHPALALAEARLSVTRAIRAGETRLGQGSETQRQGSARRGGYRIRYTGEGDKKRRLRAIFT